MMVVLDGENILWWILIFNLVLVIRVAQMWGPYIPNVYSSYKYWHSKNIVFVTSIQIRTRQTLTRLNAVEETVGGNCLCLHGFHHIEIITILIFPCRRPSWIWAEQTCGRQPSARRRVKLELTIQLVVFLMFKPNNVTYTSTTIATAHTR